MTNQIVLLLNVKHDADEAEESGNIIHSHAQT
jgi:hypothetical protein